MKTIKYIATHLMLALAVLTQLTLPIQAACEEGYNGDYVYLYDPVSEGHGNWTYSNLSLNTGVGTQGNNGTWFWGYTATVPDRPWPMKPKQQIYISFAHSNIVSGKVEVFKTTGGTFALTSTYYFTNYSGAFGTEMYRYYDCYNGYKLKLTINGCNFSPEIERWANN